MSRGHRPSAAQVHWLMGGSERGSGLRRAEHRHSGREERFSLLADGENADALGACIERDDRSSAQLWVVNTQDRDDPVTQRFGKDVQCSRLNDARTRCSGGRDDDAEVEVMREHDVIMITRPFRIS